jgi:hypothetical protein
VCCYHSFPRPWQTLFGFTLSTCIWDWYASDNNLRGTPRGSRKKPNAGRSPTGRLSTAVLCRGLEKNGMVGAGHWHGMASVNQIRPHCVNQMGKTHSKPLAAWHGRGTAWTRHAMCEAALTALCMWNKGCPAVPICYSWHAHIGCQQLNELSSPLEIRGHVRSIGRWKLISIPAPAKNNWYSGSTFHKEAGVEPIIVLTPTFPLWSALPEDCCSQYLKHVGVTTQYILTDLMFCWQCIVIYLYNKNQLDALFTFNLFQ